MRKKRCWRWLGPRRALHLRNLRHLTACTTTDSIVTISSTKNVYSLRMMRSIRGKSRVYTERQLKKDGLRQNGAIDLLLLLLLLPLLSPKRGATKKVVPKASALGSTRPCGRVMVT